MTESGVMMPKISQFYLMAVSICFVFATTRNAFPGETAKKETNESIINELLTPSDDEVSGLSDSNPVLDKIKLKSNKYAIIGLAWKKAKDLTEMERVVDAVLFTSLQMQESEHKYQPKYNLIDSNAVGMLVKFLECEKNGIKEKVAGIINGFCPDDTIRSRGLEIINAIRKEPFAGRLKLLGKTGCSEARVFLNAELVKANKESTANLTKLALAKLGDIRYENEFVKKFVKENDSAKKAKYAENLGYIGSPQAVAALLSEMRSSLVVKQNGGGELSIQFCILKALNDALPNRELFWAIKHRSKKIYPCQRVFDEIEAWAVNNMHIKYDKPKPAGYSDGTVYVPSRKAF